MIPASALNKLGYAKILQYITRYSITEKGKQYVLSLQPLFDKIKIKKECETVTQAKDILSETNAPPLEFISNLSESLSRSRIENAGLEISKILEVHKLAVISRNIYQFLKSHSGRAPLLYQQAQNLFVDKTFEYAIERVISERGEIKDNASVKLMEIRRDLKEKKNEVLLLVNRLKKIIENKNIVQEEYLTLRDGRIVIPVKAEHKRHIRGFIHSESATGLTVYIEPEQTLELNNEIVSLSFAEKREMGRLLKLLTKRIGEASRKLQNSLEIISYIDSIFARAKYSIEIIGCFPEINNEKIISILDARHPVLLKKLGKENTVPLNVKLDKKIILITGPNAGGKTVVLQTIGLLSLMLQSGIHVPVQPDSNFHVFSNIFIDIGDEQSIEDDISTFSSHLSNIKNILSKADSNSLVLIDEIGTGTDPSEGTALAAASLIKLNEANSTVFATTHHGKLKLIVYQIDGFENAAMEFDTKNLQPTYKFKQGIPGSSYALEVAKRIGLSDDFLSLAAKYLEPDKNRVENFLIDLETKSKELKNKLDKIEIENTRLKGLSSLYQQNIDKLNSEKKEIIKKVKTEANEYLNSINKKFENLVRDLKESNAGTEIIKSSKKVIKDLKKVNDNILKEDIDLIKENHSFTIGNIVAIKNTATIGEIIVILEGKRKAVLRVGSIKMLAKMDDLIPAKMKEPEHESKSYNINLIDKQIRIDIRGEKPEIAEFEVIKFVDNAYSAGMNKVEILHGKGTGVLKKTVKEILEKHEKVKRFYFAPIEFGGEGITIVEIE